MEVDEKILKDKWNQSYQRKENYIYYPKNEIIIFLSRYIRKRIGMQKFQNIYDFSKTVKACDYGCGIGRQTILLKEFGIDAYGIDISQEAIKEAKYLASSLGMNLDNNLIVGDGETVPFENNFFDFSIAESVLDSTCFQIAQSIIAELDRVTKKYCFISLISGDYCQDPCFSDKKVTTAHEKDTIQSYYGLPKILDLIEPTQFVIKECSLVTNELMVPSNPSSTGTITKEGRYYVVLEKYKQ